MFNWTAQLKERKNEGRMAEMDKCGMRERKNKTGVDYRQEDRSRGGCGRYNDITGMVAWEVHNSRSIITP